MPAVGDGVATGEGRAGPDAGAGALLSSPVRDASASGLASGVLPGNPGESACEGEEAKSGSEGASADSGKGEEAETGAKGSGEGEDKGES